MKVGNLHFVLFVQHGFIKSWYIVFTFIWLLVFGLVISCQLCKLFPVKLVSFV